MTLKPLRIALCTAALLSFGFACTSSLDAPTDVGRVAITAASLDLVGVGDVVWDIEVVNGAATPDVVWQRRITASAFGDGVGSAAFVGPCDADTGVAQNTVRLWLVGAYDADIASADAGTFNAGSDAGAGTVTGTPIAIQSPTAGGPVERTVTCLPNQDVPVRFDVAVLRPAQQGFFDVAVTFKSRFCSAKLDCCRDANDDGCALDGSEDLNLLHDAAGQRDRTIVIGFACTGGPGEATGTTLYMSDIELDCTAPNGPGDFTADVVIDPDAGPNGNQCTPGADGMSSCAPVITEVGGADADTWLYQIGVYRGDEALTSGGVTANKRYWNIALGVTGAIGDCRLRLDATVDDPSDPEDGMDGGTINAGVIYPIIEWDADLGTCAEEPLTFTPGAPVRPLYTLVDTAGLTFENSAGDAPAPTTCGVLGECPTGFTCVNGATCEHLLQEEVWVPSGTFWQGCRTGDVYCSSATGDEAPQRLVTLSQGYAIDKYEVQADNYRLCVEEGGAGCTVPSTTEGSFGTYGPPDPNPNGKRDHPINYVDWYQADAYCAWPDKPQGVQRLCTEAEWERAARGGCETLTGDCKTTMRLYPWGDAFPDCTLANHNPGSQCEPVTFTAAVGSYPAGASFYGAHDMAGNVNEWVNDWYFGTYNDNTAGPPDYNITDPPGDSGNTRKVLRGGGWSSTGPNIRSSDWPNNPRGTTSSSLGLRCCRTVP